MTMPTSHPYRDLPRTSFWKKAVVEASAADLDPFLEAPFSIEPADPIASAGSCFAQHVARALPECGFTYLVTERSEHGPDFSARYGNIYTTLQLRQLMEQAYGLFRPKTSAWQRPDGRWIDPFRQQEFPAGFDDADGVAAERRLHLRCVRRVFETCKVFVFTLGLTEAWVSDADGAAVPLPPGVIAQPPEAERFSFKNLDVESMLSDISRFASLLREVNAAAKILLTVSPVSLAATYERKHVLSANTLSKAALRVTAEYASTRFAGVHYFPSYEIIAGRPGSLYFEPDLRSVTPSGVAHVMRVFRDHFASKVDPVGIVHEAGAPPASPTRTLEPGLPSGSNSEFRTVICDEERLAG